MSDLPRHPDTIPGLAPDCRRVLREAYQTIQVRMQTVDRGAPQLRDVPTQLPGQRHRTRDELREILAARRREYYDGLREAHRDVGSAIADYRYAASLWGVDVG